MSAIFIDTSYFLTIGVLSSDYEWLSYKKVESTKGASAIHALVYEELSKSGISAIDIKNVFQIAGPGSYTGVRLSSGMAQVFEWSGANLFSFYHFDIPKILDVSDGEWITNAYKGEIFSHTWDGSSENDMLMRDVQIVTHKFKDRTFTHYLDSFGGFKDAVLSIVKPEETSQLIERNPKLVFKRVEQNNLRKAPFYFRTIEQEFKKGSDFPE